MKKETTVARRNEEISDIIDRMPTRFGKHIAIAVVLFALIITGLGWIIQYPDVVTGQVTINSDASPVTLVAGSSGKIHLNGIRPRDAVREGDYLAILQNAANTADVRRVARLLGGFNPNAPVSEWADTLPEKLSLGELNLKYFTFLSAVKTLSDYQKDNTYEQQIKSLEEYIHWQRLLLEQTAADTATTLAKLNMLDKWLKRQNRLYGKDMIPEKEYDDMHTSRLNAYAEDRQLHRSLTSLHAQIAEAEGSLNLLRTQKAENERNMHLDLLSAYSDLLDNIKTWEEKYVFKAPMDGQVEFLQFFGENQYLQAGEEVFSVVPSRNAIFGQMLLPAAGAGKVKTDSPVIIKLDNYPYLEYGTIDGRVSSISLVTKNEEMAGSHVATYLITIELPQGLTTNYGQTLDFKHEIQGTAEIVANDRRLIERLFDNLKYRTH